MEVNYGGAYPQYAPARNAAAAETLTCNRCGIEFDPTGMSPGSLCVDCQEVTGEVVVDVWSREHEFRDGTNGTQLPPEIYAERVKQIRYYTMEKKWSSKAIAKRLGITDRTVSRWRKRIGETVPQEEITLRAMMWRKEPAPPRREGIIPRQRRVELYNLHKVEGWSQVRIERELAVTPGTMRRIIREVERGDYPETSLPLARSPLPS